jgi:orotidine-5'-phosphate decarboxylase
MTVIKKLENIRDKNSSLLCIGLDINIDRMPDCIKKDSGGLLDFNKAIIDATKDIVCAYKMNFAFYEQYGIEGFKVLKETFEYIPENIFTIADAKRGDIGHTSKAYAKSCFEYFNADSVTINPYPGYDTVKPFLEYDDKLIFLLTITSNKSSSDFQRLSLQGEPLYKHVIFVSKDWANNNRIGYVIGAHHAEEILSIRHLIPESWFLIPGVGAQGANAKKIILANGGGPAIINVSRDVIYASSDKNFAEASRDKAIFYRKLFNNEK